MLKIGKQYQNFNGYIKLLLYNRAISARSVNLYNKRIKSLPSDLTMNNCSIKK